MMPYEEDQNLIIQFLDRLKEEKGEEWLKTAIGCGHLSVMGAKRYSSLSALHEGPTPSTAFGGLKRTFSGHFHLHQTLPGQFTYVGSPLQFNFGDTGDDRGIVVYDTSADSFVHVINPHCHAFRKIDFKDLAFAENNSQLFKNVFVAVQYHQPQSLTEQQKAKELLLRLGALDVVHESHFKQSIRQTPVKDFKGENVNELVEEYVDKIYQTIDIRKKAGQEWANFLKQEGVKEILLESGKDIIRSVDSSQKDKNIGEGAMFNGEISSLTLTDFMGVQGTLTFPLGQLPQGIWLIEGANGSGKSTMLEGISWCLFGEFLRSDMVKDFSINDQAKECHVRVEFANGYTVQRTRRKGKPDVLQTFKKEEENGSVKEIYLHEFEKGELKNTQMVLESLLGINFRTFSKSIILGQNIVSNFLSGGKDQRRSIIEETLGMDRFDDFHAEAKTRRKSTEKEMDILSRLHSEAQRQVESLQELVNSTVDEEKYSVTSQQKRQLEHQRKTFQEENKTQTEQLEKDLLLAKETLSSLSLEASQDLKKEIMEYRTMLKEVSGVYALISPLAKDESSCPTCEQPLDQMRREEILLRCLNSSQEVIDKLIALDAPIAVALPSSPSISSLSLTLKKLLKDVENFLLSLEKRLTEEQKAVTAAQQKVNQLEVSKLQLSNALLQKLNVLQRQQGEIERELLRLEQNKDLHANREEELKVWEGKVSEYSRSLASLQQTFQICHFWEITFDKQR